MTIVPMLRVGMHWVTRHGCNVTQSVTKCITTRSVGTRNLTAYRANAPRWHAFLDALRPLLNKRRDADLCGASEVS